MLLIVSSEKLHLVFEKRVDGNRLNIKMLLPEEYDLYELLELLNEKIKNMKMFYYSNYNVLHISYLNTQVF